MAHEKWQTQQIAALVELGVNPVDAEASVDFVLRHLPAGADPATYILPDTALIDELTTREVVADARVAFYTDEDVPARYKRILDAGEAT